MIGFPNGAFFKQMHLRLISENPFRGELILYSKNCNQNWQGLAVHYCQYSSFIKRYISVDVLLIATLG